MCAARNLTDRFVQSVSVENRTDYYDQKAQGLLLRVTPKGAKSWSYLYRRQSDGARRRLTLGKFPAMTLADARRVVLDQIRDVAHGGDPAGDRASTKAADTVNELLDRYLAKHAVQKRSAKEDERIFLRDVRPAIGAMKAESVTRQDVLRLLDAIEDRGAGVMANRTLAAVRKAFNWGVEKGHVRASPIVGVKAPTKETARDRVLSEREIFDFWHGLQTANISEAVSDALQLALITGQRIGEICGLRADDLDLSRGEWMIPAERQKKGLTHLVPLSGDAKSLIEKRLATADGEFLFPNKLGTGSADVRVIAKTVRRNLAALGLTTPATPHDIRRTVATNLARKGCSDNLIAAILGHRSQKQNSITARVYNQYDQANEKREALEAWAIDLRRMVSSKVINYDQNAG